MSVEAILAVSGIIFLIIGILGRKITLEAKDVKITTDAALSTGQRIFLMALGFFLILISIISPKELTNLIISKNLEITETPTLQPMVTATFTIEAGNQATKTSSTEVPIFTQTSMPENFISLVIPATIKWFRTGINLNEGQRIEIVSYGNWTNLDGQYDMFGAVGLDQIIPNALMPNEPLGALIGRVGTDGDPFYVGGNLSFTVIQTGELSLCMNDTLFSDNAGEMTVEVWLP